MKTGYFASVVTAFFVVASCATLAAVIWFVGSELFLDSQPMASVSGQSGSVKTEKAESGRPQNLWRGIHSDAGGQTNDNRATAEAAETSAINPARPGAVAVPSADGEQNLSPPVPPAQPNADAMPRAAEPALRAREAPNRILDLRVVFKTERENKRLKRIVSEWRPAFLDITAANQVTVEARVLGGHKRGESVDLRPVWIPTDPEMVSVSPQSGSTDTALITVSRAGQSTLKVSSQGISKDLTIDASYENEGMRVKITQQ